MIEMIERAKTMKMAMGVAGLGLALGLLAGACGGGSSSDDAADTEALTCEHGTMSPCVCTDGSMGTQLCAHDSSGFEACMCGGDESTAGTTGSTAPPGTGSASSGDGDTTTDGPADGSSSGAVDGSSSSGSEPIGEPPTVQINHPGDGEMRQVDVPIPFIGVANDAEDGPLSGASMQWTSDLEGPIGQGEAFDAPLGTVGMHVITLTATDSDGNATEVSITLDMIP